MKSFKELVSELDEACWKNYKMVGTKKKGGKTVPNCVPESESCDCGSSCDCNSIDEKMDPTDHVSKKGGKFAVVNINGKTLKTFDDKEEADAYAIKFHDKVMNKIEEKSAAWQRNMNLGISRRHPTNGHLCLCNPMRPEKTIHKLSSG